MNSEVERDAPSCINMQILRASHYVLKTYDDAYRDLGIRATQMPVVGLVARKGPITIRQIADEMESERSVMSRKLQVMVKNGWITEDPATTGKEKSFILAEEGKALIKRVLPVKQKVQENILNKLSTEERNLLLNLCSKLKEE